MRLARVPPQRAWHPVWRLKPPWVLVQPEQQVRKHLPLAALMQRVREHLWLAQLQQAQWPLLPGPV
ncbi:hypothetical protein GCM10025779_19420 [Arthrobacter cryoconiti]